MLYSYTSWLWLQAWLPAAVCEWACASAGAGAAKLHLPAEQQLGALAAGSTAGAGVGVGMAAAELHLPAEQQLGALAGGCSASAGVWVWLWL